MNKIILTVAMVLAANGAFAADYVSMQVHNPTGPGNPESAPNHNLLCAMIHH